MLTNEVKILNPDLSQGWDQRGDVLQLAQEVRGLTPSEMKRLRQLKKKRQTEEDRGASVIRQGDAAGRDPPKVLKPVRQGQWWITIRSTWRVSIRRACRVLLVERSTYQYRSRQAGQAQLLTRLRRGNIA